MSKLEYIKKKKCSLDPILTTGILILSFIGLVVIYSFGAHSITYSTDKVSSHALLIQQFSHFCLGIFILIFISRVNLNRYMDLIPWAYWANIFLLLLVFIFGDTLNGARRWLSIGTLSIQPSQFIPLTLPLMLCYLIKNELLPLNFKTLHKLIFFSAIPILLILVQPDLSTALMVGLSAAAVIVFSGFRIKLLLILFVYLVPISLIVWSNLLDYQRTRLLDYLNSFENITNSNLQVLEAMSSTAAGGLTGQKFQNIQNFYLSDFAFATYANEFGWIGSVFLIGLYVVLTLRGLYLSNRAKTQFGSILIASLVLTFFFINITNLLMVIHILPAMGIPLVFVSHSGSAFITWSIGFAIIMSLNNYDLNLEDQYQFNK